MSEEWRPIPSIPEYEVSSLGHIRCKTERSHGVRRIRGTWHRDRHRVMLNRRSYAVPRLILEAFVGPPEPGMQAAHLNGNSRDNRIANLVWATRAENESHKVAHGTATRGSKSSLATLTEREVRAVRYLLDVGVWAREIANAFGVSHGAIENIKNGRTWMHMDNQDIARAALAGNGTGEG